MKKISWKDSIWFFDIDDTLIDTAGLSALATEGIFNTLKNKLGADQSQKIKNEVDGIFNLMLQTYRIKNESEWNNVAGGKAAFDLLIQNIEGCQKEIKEKYGSIKKWSREVFIKIACDRLSIGCSPDLIKEAADAYWLSLTEKSFIFEHALKLIDSIKRHSRPVYLITSSDGRLKLKDNGQFEYDPAYSESLKRQRIELLKQKGLDFRSVSIGDPEDKPHKDFFMKGIKQAEGDLGTNINYGKLIMVGDSYSGDLQTPRETMGIGLAVLFKKGSNETRLVDDNLVETGNLAETTQFLSE